MIKYKLNLPLKMKNEINDIIEKLHKNIDILKVFLFIKHNHYDIKEKNIIINFYEKDKQIFIYNHNYHVDNDIITKNLEIYINNLLKYF